jgi:1-acyl-sn-glycerol-3-phosphate acyltransferase
LLQHLLGDHKLVPDRDLTEADASWPLVMPSPMRTPTRPTSPTADQQPDSQACRHGGPARDDGLVATARRWRRPERFYDRLAPLARLVVWLLADLRVVGAERVPDRGGVLLAANTSPSSTRSSSRWPCTTAAAARSASSPWPTSSISPLVGWVLRGTRMIPVARGRGVDRMAEDASAALDAGQAVLVYPEGTIVPPGQTRPARPGAGLVALRARVPVLPIASCGAERRRCRRLPRLRRRVTVIIGPPVDLSSWHGRLDRQAQLETSAALLASVQALRPNP